MHSNILAIAISTYNRPIILFKNLTKMLPDIRLNKIPIYISDDSNNNDTRAVIEILQQQYEFIFYRKNEKQLGHDANFIESLTWPKSKYIWYLGDSMYFEPDTLNFILKVIESDPDFIFVNSHGGRAKYENGPIKNTMDFFEKTSWHLTLSGCTIYSNRFCEWLKTTDSSVLKYQNFVQLGSIFEYYSIFQGKIYWAAAVIVETNKDKISYWQHNAIKVFAYDWGRAIEFAPIFTSDQKKSVIQSHARNTGLFGVKNLFSLRAEGAYSSSIYCKYKNEIREAIIIPPWVAFFISIIPQWLAKIMVTFVKNSRDRCNELNFRILNKQNCK